MVELTIRVTGMLYLNVPGINMFHHCKPHIGLSGTYLTVNTMLLIQNDFLHIVMLLSILCHTWFHALETARGIYARVPIWTGRVETFVYILGWW